MLGVRRGRGPSVLHLVLETEHAYQLIAQPPEVALRLHDHLGRQVARGNPIGTGGFRPLYSASFELRVDTETNYEVRILDLSPPPDEGHRQVPDRSRRSDR